MRMRDSSLLLNINERLVINREMRYKANADAVTMGLAAACTV